MELIYEDNGIKLRACYERVNNGNGFNKMLCKNDIDPRTRIIGEFAFYANDSFNYIFLPDEISTIGAYAFAYCMGLVTLELPKKLLIIEDEAFKKCIHLKSITIPKNVKIIHSSAFRDCIGLEEINFETLPTLDVKSSSDRIFSNVAPKIIRIKGKIIDSSNIKDLKALKRAGMSFENLKVEDECLQLLIEVGEI